MTEFLILFLEFFKIGLFAIGGGLATLPFLMELSELHPLWLTMDDISNMIAVSESTPGPMGINMATFVGNNVGNMVTGSSWGGILGGILATLGEVMPSLIIIMLIAGVLTRFRESKWVKWSFYGLRATVIALIASAACSVYSVTIFREGSLHIPELAVFALLLAAMMKWKKVHPALWILLAAVIGMLFPLFGYTFL